MAQTALDGSNGIIRNLDFNTPVTGFSYTVPAGVVGTVFTPAGTLATGTVIMPAAPVDGMTISLSSSQAIDALTISPNTGQSISNAVTTLAAGAAISYFYRSANTTWYTQGVTVADNIQSISASVAANALTIGASALALDFRSATLGSGTVTTVSGTPANIVVPDTALLGTVNAVRSRLAVLALNNAGAIELAVVNTAGGNDLSETGVVSTTALSTAADAANVIYSTTARTSLAYRVIGYIESTQTTAGTWATAPSTIQGAGGNAVAAMSSLGYSQAWQDLTASRALATTYYNTTGRPIVVSYNNDNSTSGVSTATVNGLAIAKSYAGTAAYAHITVVVPPGGSYSFAAGAAFASWFELR